MPAWHSKVWRKFRKHLVMALGAEVRVGVRSGALQRTEGAGPIELTMHAGARLVAGDGLRGFELVQPEPAVAHFRRKAGRDRLAPGERWEIGWLRLDKDVELQVEIKTP